MDLLFFVIIVIIPTLAQLQVTSEYSKYKKVNTQKKLSGCEIARKILDENGLSNVHIVETKGTLSDHYDPSRKVIRLSHDIFHGESIASASVAAHECGHAIQDKEGYSYMRFRSMIFPIVNLGTGLSYYLILLGLITYITDLVWFGIGLTFLGLLFQIITLPVEFDASKRAKEELIKLNLTTDDELVGTKKVLNAAALTYIAGVLTSAVQIFWLIMNFSDDNR